MQSQLIQRGGGRELAIVLHGPHGSPKEMRGVIDKALASREKRSDGGFYDCLLIAGYSASAVIARKVAIVAHGETPDDDLVSPDYAVDILSHADHDVYFLVVETPDTTHHAAIEMRKPSDEQRRLLNPALADGRGRRAIGGMPQIWADRPGAVPAAREGRRRKPGRTTKYRHIAQPHGGHVACHS